MKKLTLFSFLALFIGLTATAYAHTVSMSWRVEANGDYTFFAETYHVSEVTYYGPQGGLIIDGTVYPFTGYVTSLPGDIDGTAEWYTWSGTTVWQTVTASGFVAGEYTVTTTSWSAVEWPFGTIVVNIVPSTITVNIDIKPGSDPNSINLKSNGVIPVAILGSSDYDVSDIDVSSLAFGPGGASAAHDGHLEDVNDDGLTDLVVHFPTQDTGLSDGDTEATLTGQTNGGQDLEGSDSVRIAPGSNKGKAGKVATGMQDASWGSIKDSFK